MAVREIRLQGAPVLREKGKRIRNFNDPYLRQLAGDLLDTMREAQGIGLAAHQIGVPLRMCVLEMPEEDEDHPGERYVLINPEVIKAEGQMEGVEGCLSFPGYVADIARAERVVVKAQDLAGKTFRVKGQGLLSRALQHEIDHLQGILFVDHLDSLDKLRRVEDAAREPSAEMIG